MSRSDERPTAPELAIPAAILVGVTCTPWTPPEVCAWCRRPSARGPLCGHCERMSACETPGPVPTQEMPEAETRPQCRRCFRDVRDCVCRRKRKPEETP